MQRQQMSWTLEFVTGTFTLKGRRQVVGRFEGSGLDVLNRETVSPYILPR
jgi:hypothetical protein